MMRTKGPRIGIRPMIPVHDPALAQAIGRAAGPLPDLDDAAFGRCFERWSDHRLLIMGEDSHGTAEFCRARAAITRHLFEHRHTRIVALEADWPDAAFSIVTCVVSPPTPMPLQPFSGFRAECGGITRYRDLPDGCATGTVADRRRSRRGSTGWTRIT